MIDSNVKTKIESNCGIYCSECKFLKENVCLGCTNIEKPFWGDSCAIKDCCKEKKVDCCGECTDFPCELLNSFAYDKEQGDNGARIENCRRWCSR